MEEMTRRIPEGNARSGWTLTEARKHESVWLTWRSLASLEWKCDNVHATTPPVKVARMLISVASTGSTVRQRIHDIRGAFFHALVEDFDMCSHATRNLESGACGFVAQNFVRHQKAVDRALKELEFVHLVVGLCNSFQEVWNMALTNDGRAQVPGCAGRGTCSVLGREVSGSQRSGIPGRGRSFKRKCRGAPKGSCGTIRRRLAVHHSDENW